MQGLTVMCQLERRRRLPRSEKPAPPRRLIFEQRLQQRLALAHLIERKIEAGELRDYAEAARLLGVTRARLSQLADLVLLPADVQSAILEGRMEGVSERQVRVECAVRHSESG